MWCGETVLVSAGRHGVARRATVDWGEWASRNLVVSGPVRGSEHEWHWTESEWWRDCQFLCFFERHCLRSVLQLDGQPERYRKCSHWHASFPDPRQHPQRMPPHVAGEALKMVAACFEVGLSHGVPRLQAQDPPSTLEATNGLFVVKGGGVCHQSMCNRCGHARFPLMDCPCKVH